VGRFLLLMHLFNLSVVQIAFFCNFHIGYQNSVDKDLLGLKNFIGMPTGNQPEYLKFSI